VKDIRIARGATTWRDPDTTGPQQRAHTAIAALRLIPPLTQRLERVGHRVGEFAVSAVIAALLLSFLCLYLQETRGLPPWGLTALLLVVVGVIVLKAILSFGRERVVVAYRHRHSKSIGRSKPDPMDIDKAWEPIEAALERLDNDDAQAIREAVVGGREIKGADVGFGAASYFSAEEVAGVATSLSRMSAEALANACAPEVREYVASHLRNLQTYFRDAAAHGHAMIRYFC